MAHYPDILFHFTTQESLYEILRNTFKVSYAREKIEGGTIVKELGVPMVSFCDLRLSELKDNIGTYGQFGIGMTKEWAIRSGLNPVMYVSRESLFTEKFLDAFGVLHKKINGTPNQNEADAYHNLLNTLRYMKNYKGDLRRREKKTTKNYVFANEREWRYVPPFDHSIIHYANIKDLDTLEKKQNLNRKASTIRLDFKPEDIKYLIVKADSDIYPLISHIRDVKHRFTPEIIDRLASRILTYEQICKDV